MSNVFLKPARTAAGAPLLVRDPMSRLPLLPNGEWKSLSPFWSRRLRDGDVIAATPPSPAGNAAPDVVAADPAPANSSRRRNPAG